jgi:hypothetical protein
VNYPNQPGTPGYPPYPPQNPQGAPGYGYAPQQQQYQQQPPPGYYQQGPPQQQWQQPAPQAPVLARGTLEDYLDQPTGGGGAATSKFFTPQRPIGSWLQLVVARDLNNNDVRQQTDKFGTPLTFKSNGKPKFVLIIPCNVLSSSDGSHVNIYPEGQVTVWLKGVPSDSFKSAMRTAGVGDPDRALALGQLAGASFYMIGAGTKQFGAGNPANMFDFQYTPNGRELAEPVPPTQPAQVAPPTGAVTQTAPAADPNSYAAAYQQATGQLPPTQPAAPPAAASPPPVPTPPQQYAQQLPPVPPPGLPAQPPPPGAPQGFPPPPAGYGQPQLDPEKAALLQRLQGQQQ